ncbi:ephrin type-A receptor 5-like [Scomber japonicus]|uniref:ephrin type-A receptor 5-like n=1 Tax=Scomber japonicus TaxID=13676 RepID=UPI002306A1BE|nr:ephrin type-A receptor 5-like [Scomber japonicus]
MAVCNTILWAVWPTSVLLCVWIWEANCDVKYQSEEVEIFHSDKQSRLGWTSEPSRGSKWGEIPLKFGTVSPVPVLQACGGGAIRTILSPWMERKDAHYLLMDVAFAKVEEQQSGQVSLLQARLVKTDIPTTRDSQPVLDLQTTPFPATLPLNEISNYLNRSKALNLGSISHKGFRLGFSYSGTCVFVTSIRLYYRRCLDTVANLALFGKTVAGSGALMFSCVEGAVVVSPPVRECTVDGVWGPVQGGCTCKPGHQAMNDTCQACRLGYYKPANESGECRMCPPNSGTHREGSEKCDCVQGFSRLPTDPDDLGCTKPPSAPVNATARHHNDSVLIVTWDPPHDRGGRQEVTYRVKCKEQAEVGGQWKSCGEQVVFLTNTSVSITKLNPQRDYMLSVEAWNDILTLPLPGAPSPSTATVTIHRCMLT